MNSDETYQWLRQNAMVRLCDIAAKYGFEWGDKRSGAINVEQAEWLMCRLEVCPNKDARLRCFIEAIVGPGRPKA